MKKRFKIFSILLAIVLVFSMLGSSVSEAKKYKKNPNWPKMKWEWISGMYLGFNEKSEPFKKYLKEYVDHNHDDYTWPSFEYDGQDEEIHLPCGLFLWGSFAPYCRSNYTVKRLYIYTECGLDSQLEFRGGAIGRYFRQDDGDLNSYLSLYQLKALEQIIIVKKYTNMYCAWTTKNNGTRLIYKTFSNKILWDRYKRVPW